MGKLMDTTDVYAVSSDGEYHRSSCLELLGDCSAESLHELPEGAELEDCCSRV
jgi:hypothetical protein